MCGCDDIGLYYIFGRYKRPSVAVTLETERVAKAPECVHA